MPWAWAYPVSSGIAISVAPARPNAAESHVPSVVTPSFASSDISVEVATCAGATQRGKVSHDRWRRAGNGTAGNAQSVGGRQLTAIDTVHHGDSVRTHSQPASPSARPHQQRHAAWHGIARTCFGCSPKPKKIVPPTSTAAPPPRVKWGESLDSVVQVPDGAS